MAEAQATEKHPLDEVMLAMDVVDTLRHRALLVERELHTEDRDQKLLERLRELYAAQGIEVPEHVLQEGVRALREDRFTYKPPAPGLGVTLARLYIHRARWGKGLLAMVALVPRAGVGIRSPWAGSARLLGRSWEAVGGR
jgi:Family of unknown function (DUF6384)